MKIKTQLAALKPYDPGMSPEEIKHKYGLAKVVKLDANENPYGCSELVRKVITQSSYDIALYPDGASEDLRNHLSARLKVDRQSLLFGNGLDEVIQIISRATLTSESNIVMAAPTFSQYRLHAVIEGAEVREVKTANGRHDLNGMLKQIDDKTRVVWVCNPNNPTGTYVGETEFKAFLEKVPSQSLVVVDEAYIEYVTAADYPDTLSMLDGYSNLLILRTFSKAYGLAGLRIGYAIGQPELIQSLETTRLPFNTSSLAQRAAIAALDDEAFINQCARRNREALEIMTRFCDTSGLDYYPSQTNFLFIKTDESQRIYEGLLSKGFVTRPFPDGLRITMGRKDDLKELLSHFGHLIDHPLEKTS
ncbi:histidinol-phosphate transaminase [Camelliibacillus cellulosilyticus]|uniref:Histidinol-phosphate aminotransferase n=1 Tax=Camelliibacillus cellulosilyticus TaxID=2174486 RepID=A0ABV9GND8_9BACL